MLASFDLRRFAHRLSGFGMVSGLGALATTTSAAAQSPTAGLIGALVSVASSVVAADVHKALANRSCAAEVVGDRGLRRLLWDCIQDALQEEARRLDSKRLFERAKAMRKLSDAVPRSWPRSAAPGVADATRFEALGIRDEDLPDTLRGDVDPGVALERSSWLEALRVLRARRGIQLLEDRDLDHAATTLHGTFSARLHKLLVCDVTDNAGKKYWGFQLLLMQTLLTSIRSVQAGTHEAKTEVLEHLKGLEERAARFALEALDVVQRGQMHAHESAVRPLRDSLADQSRRLNDMGEVLAGIDSKLQVIDRQIGPRFNEQSVPRPFRHSAEDRVAFEDAFLFVMEECLREQAPFLTATSFPPFFSRPERMQIDRFGRKQKNRVGGNGVLDRLLRRYGLWNRLIEAGGVYAILDRGTHERYFGEEHDLAAEAEEQVAHFAAMVRLPGVHVGVLDQPIPETYFCGPSTAALTYNNKPPHLTVPHSLVKGTLYEGPGAGKPYRDLFHNAWSTISDAWRQPEGVAEWILGLVGGGR